MGTVTLENVILPEFLQTRKIKTIKAYVFDNPGYNHDIIMGRETLAECEMLLDFGKQVVIYVRVFGIERMV